MPRTDRLVDLIQILGDGRLHRARDLAERLGVSVRTVWRDMGTLMSRGLPVEGERGVGYMLSTSTTLPPVALTREELEALRLGIVLAGASADPAIARAATSLRAKVAAVTPGGIEESGADTFVFSSPEAARAAPHLALIRRALREHLVLRAATEESDGSMTDDQIRPLQLEFWGRYWTLTAWSEGRGDFRVFRIDRFRSLSAEPAAFLPEAGRTVDDYVQRLTAT